MTNIMARFNTQYTTVSIPNKEYVEPELKILGGALSFTLVLLCIIPAAALIRFARLAWEEEPPMKRQSKPL